MDKIRNMAKAGSNSGKAGEVEGAKGKKGKKMKKESNSNKKLDSITCSTCKTVFTDQESKILCCDRCELWFYISCANVTDMCYKFLSSKDAIDITWYCKACKLLAKKAITEDRNTEQKCMEYTKELKQKMKSIEAIMQRKVDVTELQELQKKVEENENKIKELMEESNKVKIWADIMDTPEKRTVEEVIAKSLKERDNEEKKRQKKKHNCI